MTLNRPLRHPACDVRTCLSARICGVQSSIPCRGCRGFNSIKIEGTAKGEGKRNLKDFIFILHHIFIGHMQSVLSARQNYLRMQLPTTTTTTTTTIVLLLLLQLYYYYYYQDNIRLDKTILLTSHPIIECYKHDTARTLVSQF